MVSPRLVDAMLIARAVRQACGGIPELDEALRLLEECVEGGAGCDPSYAVDLLYEAASRLRALGCLEWYQLEEAARILETLGY